MYLVLLKDKDKCCVRKNDVFLIFFFFKICKMDLFHFIYLKAVDKKIKISTEFRNPWKQLSDLLLLKEAFKKLYT